MKSGLGGRWWWVGEEAVGSERKCIGVCARACFPSSSNGPGKKKKKKMRGRIRRGRTERDSAGLKMA